MRGLLLYGDTERSAALRHEIPVPIGDAFLFAEAGGGLESGSRPTSVAGSV